MFILDINFFCLFKGYRRRDNDRSGNGNRPFERNGFKPRRGAPTKEDLDKGLDNFLSKNREDRDKRILKKRNITKLHLFFLIIIWHNS